MSTAPTSDMYFGAYPPGYRFSAMGISAIVAAHALIVGLLFVAKAPSLPTQPSALMVQIIAPQPLTVGPEIPETKPVPPEIKPPVRPKPKPAVRRAPPKPIEKPAAKPVLAAQVPQIAVSAALDAITPPELDEPAINIASEASAPTPSATATSASGPATVSPARFNADYLQNPAPVYPSLARRMGEEGRVVLRVFVEASGLPSRIEVRTGSGSPRLDQAALDAVGRWKFAPARRGEETIAAWVLVPIVFNLRN